MVIRNLLFGIVALVLAGCVNVRSQTSVQADGIATRQLTVQVMKEQFEEPENAFPAKNRLVFGSDDTWKPEIKEEKDKFIITAASKLAVDGMSARSFEIHDKTGPYLRCESRITKTSETELLYTETYTWLGKVDNDDAKMADLRKVIAAALGTEDSNKDVAEIALAIKRQIFRRMFGPGDPMFADIITDAGAAERRLKIDVFHTVDRECQQRFPNVAEPERLRIARTVAQKIASLIVQENTPNPEQDPSQSGDPDLTVINISIAGPGKVVETDGEWDPVNNEVHWSMYANAAEIGPVTLSVKFRISGG